MVGSLLFGARCSGHPLDLVHGRCGVHTASKGPVEGPTFHRGLHASFVRMHPGTAASEHTVLVNDDDGVGFRGAQRQAQEVVGFVDRPASDTGPAYNVFHEMNAPLVWIIPPTVLDDASRVKA